MGYMKAIPAVKYSGLHVSRRKKGNIDSLLHLPHISATDIMENMKVN